MKDKSYPACVKGCKDLSAERALRKKAERRAKALEKEFAKLPNKIVRMGRELRVAEARVLKLGEMVHARDLELAALRNRLTISPKQQIPAKVLAIILRGKTPQKNKRKRVTPRAQAVVGWKALKGTKFLVSTGGGRSTSVRVESVSPEEVEEAHIE